MVPQTSLFPTLPTRLATRALRPTPRPPGRCQKVSNLEPLSHTPGNHRTSNGGAWGHRLKKKNRHTVRILLHNTCGLGTDASSKIASIKLAKLKKLVIEHEVDIIGLTEINIDWRRTTTTCKDRFHGWFQHNKICTAHNTKTSKELSTPFQPGGVASIITNAVACRVKETGQDPRHLGRWTWTKLQGKMD